MKIVSKKSYKYLVFNKIYFLLLFFMLILSLFTQCIVVIEEEFLFFKKEKETDTIPPFGPLVVVFSEEISDSVLPQFQFSPSFYSFNISYNKIRDTFYIRFPEPLEGEKRYVLRVSQTLYSKAGAVMHPMEDSIVFMTLALEKEPNNEFTDADTLKTEICGSLSTTSDRDYYIISDKIEKIVISPQDCIIKTSIYNLEKKVIFVYDEIVVSDTIILKTEDSPPYYVTIESSLKSASGYYIIRKI